MICRVTLHIDNVRSYSLINAPSSIDALLIALRMVPEHAGVKAIVRVLMPAANEQ